MQIMQSNKENQPTWIEKLSFGLGDFANNGIFTFVSTYLMYYYTDSIGLSLSAISFILVIGRVTDAVFSPVMGILVDHTNTKIGKCRPYLLSGVIPVCLLMLLMFSLPENIDNNQKFILATVAYVFFSIFYAYMNVPYSTMLSVLTPNHNQRISFNLYKTVGANLGGVFITAATLSLVNFFQKDNKSGYSQTALVFAVIFIVMIVICFANTKERVKVEKGGELKLKQSVKSMLSNPQWILLCFIQFLTLTYTIMKNQGTIYYAKYYLGNEQISSLMLTMAPIATASVMLFLPKLSIKFGNKRCVIIGNVLWCVAQVGTWIVGPHMLPALLLHGLSCAGWGMATGMIFVMLSQTIDYTQWKDGIRPQGLFTSLLATFQKLGIACAGAACSYALNMGGYIANEEATEKSLFSIRLIFCGIPFILSVCVIILSHFYHMDELYPSIEEGLEKRRSN